MSNYNRGLKNKVYKEHKQLLKQMGVEKLAIKYGLNKVFSALNYWMKYKKENAKILKEKDRIEARLKEIEKVI